MNTSEKTPKPKFPEVLQEVLDERKINKKDFAVMMGLSPSMLTKLMSGKAANTKTYVKIFNYFKKELHPGEEDKISRVADKLIKTYLQDRINSLGLKKAVGQLFTENSPYKIPKANLVYVSLFKKFDPFTVLALHIIGMGAEGSSQLRATMLALAEMSRDQAKDSNGDPLFPAGYFLNGIRRAEISGPMSDEMVETLEKLQFSKFEEVSVEA